MIARLVDLVALRNGGQRITFETREDFTEAFDDLKDSPVSVEIKRQHRKRSLTANAYCWVLIDKLAAKLGISKTEVYRQTIRDIGGVSTIVCAKNSTVTALRQNWGRNGIGWITDTMPSKVPGCTNVILYTGSSEYDSRQMAALIDHIVQDCKAVGIETMPPQEIERLMADWR